MCGIGFIINYGKDPVPLDVVKRMFIGMEDRGRDASGIYYERIGDDGKLTARLFKAPVPATTMWEMVQEKKAPSCVPESFADKWGITGKERLIMLHTRAMTHGTEYDNHNNMPIYSKNWVLVHNGVVHAERLKSYRYKGQVDSEEIIARLELNKEPKKALEDGLTGSMAIFARPSKRDCLWIYRNTNPIELVFMNNSSVLFGCSKSEYVLDEGQKKNRLNVELFRNSGVNVIQPLPFHLYRIDTEVPDMNDLGSITQYYGSTKCGKGGF